MDYRQTSEGKQPSPRYRQGNENDVADIAERYYQQYEDEHHGDGYRQDAVRLYLTGIANGYHRTTSQTYVDVLILAFHLARAVLQLTDKAAVLLCFTRTVRRLDDNHSALHVGSEDMTIVELIVQRAASVA